jgi:hypothetical protein
MSFVPVISTLCRHLKLHKDDPDVEDALSGVAVANSRHNASILRRIIYDNLPLSHRHQLGVRQLMQDMELLFTPYRTSTIRKMMTYWHSIIREQIATELNSTKWISFTINNWTENGRGYIGITAHYLHEKDNKMELRTRGLAVHRYKGRQTAEMIFNTFKV